MRFRWRVHLHGGGVDDVAAAEDHIVIVPQWDGRVDLDHDVFVDFWLVRLQGCLEKRMARGHARTDCGEPFRVVEVGGFDPEGGHVRVLDEEVELYDSVLRQFVLLSRVAFRVV